MNNIDSIIDITLKGKGDSDRHVLPLFSIGVASKAKTIIELGVRDGGTTLPLLMAASLNNGVLHSVDTKTTSFTPPSKLKPNWKFYQNDAISFLQSWDYNTDIDLVYIDDWHSYSHVKKELEILDTLVSPNTVILLNDLMYGNTCPFYH